MPNVTQPIILNEGLDTITHPLVAKQGTLIDCLNYEMTGLAGYRRIDGFERYDGWVGGEIVDYYKVNVNITDGSITASLTPGTTLNAVVGTSVPVVGVVLAYSAGVLTYAPVNMDAPVIANGTILDVNLTTTGRMTATAFAVKGSTADSASTFVTNVRAYSSTLRALVQDRQTPVCGLHWIGKNLVVAQDCPVMVYTDTTTTAQVQQGSIISYLTTVYRVVNRAYSGTTMTLHLEPISSQANNTNIRVWSEDMSTVLSTVTGASVISVTTGNSDWAYLTTLFTPETQNGRGALTMKRSVTLKFSNAGTAAQAQFQRGFIVQIGTGVGKYVSCYVVYVEVTSGTYAGGNAVGYIELILDGINLSATNNRDYITTADDLYSAGTKLADIDQVSWSVIPGTNRIRAATSHYQWVTANFFGQSDTTEAYCATGASKGFWAHASRGTSLLYPTDPSVTSADATYQYSWGSIWTDRVTVTFDIPKYVSFHGGSLAFAVYGSVVRSVAGDPRNFQGVLGATETATGDDITGLLELSDDTLVVFGKRSIRRLTGVIAADLDLKTIAAKAGCFHYSAALVGGTPVYAGPAGISSLEQSERYGDFLGSRISYRVSNTLVPKLLTDYTDSEPGGFAAALPVRAKDQYRMWMTTGEVYTVTFAQDGVKIMKSNYGLTDEIRVPLAWTSELADSGKEHAMVVWDDVLARTNVGPRDVGGSTLPNPRRIYELDRGWGFDGVTFQHYFDVTYVMGDAQAIQIVEARLSGMGYGLATLDIKSSGVEDDYDQAFHTAVQDISMPRALETFSSRMRPVTAIVDQANWGLGVKLRVNGTKAENLTTTEPSHICQVLVLHINPQGAKDN